MVDYIHFTLQRFYEHLLLIKSYSIYTGTSILSKLGYHPPLPPYVILQ